MSNPDLCVSEDTAFEQDLSMLLDGELDASRERDVRNHLEACAHCRRQLAAFEAVDQTLHGTALPPVPPGLRTRIEHAIERESVLAPNDPRDAAAADTPQRTRSGRAWGSVFWRAGAPLLALAASLAIYLAFHQPSIDLDGVSEEEIAVALELDKIRDLDVIANLELAERLAALGEGSI